MKTLYLLRHAKSSWDDSSVSDFDRPLNERGEKAAPFVGSLMKERGMTPEAIISSPAKRAKQTAKLVAKAAEFPSKISYDERIYEASTARLLAVMGEIADGIDSVMIVGHNPGMESLIWYLTGKMEPMPTAALAVIELNVDRWSDVSEGGSLLITLIRPKDEVR
jgi:phosphohistidine phosphatase